MDDLGPKAAFGLLGGHCDCAWSAPGEIGRGLTLYGLRHTVAVILRECGFDERTIADALGQKTIEMARHYARGVDLKPKMRGVVEAFERSVNERRTKIVKPT
jgi:integrase